MKPYNPQAYKLVSLRELPTIEYTADTPEQIARFYRENIPNDIRYSPDQECFITIMMNTRKKIIGYVILSTGLKDQCLCHPGEFYRPACIANAAAVVAVHNHPSGDPSPSESDIKITRQLRLAGEVLKIELLDHIIMGLPSPERTRDYVSLRELGYFYQ